MMHNPLNKIIMYEIGLTVDNHQRVIDQDTREQLKFKDKNIKYSSQNSVVLTKNDIPFDPAETRNLMSSLFDHFARKVEEQDDIYISRYYDITDNEKGTALEVIVDGKKITSDFYKNDSLRYLDVIMQINGSKKVDLKQYDVESTNNDNKKGKRKR